MPSRQEGRQAQSECMKTAAVLFHTAESINTINNQSQLNPPLSNPTERGVTGGYHRDYSVPRAKYLCEVFRKHFGVRVWHRYVEWEKRYRVCERAAKRPLLNYCLRKREETTARRQQLQSIVEGFSSSSSSTCCCQQRWITSLQTVTFRWYLAQVMYVYS